MKAWSDEHPYWTSDTCEACAAKERRAERIELVGNTAFLGLLILALLFAVLLVR